MPLLDQLGLHGNIGGETLLSGKEKGAGFFNQIGHAASGPHLGLQERRFAVGATAHLAWPRSPVFPHRPARQLVHPARRWGMVGEHARKGKALANAHGQILPKACVKNQGSCGR
ncbi:MAG: hypothetical protein N4A65_14125 [Cohaesibacter sp.]|jgi:hypothetical protein|nr:hypothetical protein [Cohaesibacter sp.]